MFLLFEIIEYTAGILTYLYCFFFLSLLFKKTKRFSLPLVFIFLIPCTLLAWYPINDISPEWFSFLSIFLQFCMSWMVFDGKLFQKCIATILFYAGELLLANIVSSIISLLTKTTMITLITPGTPIRVTYLIMLYLIEAFIVMLIYRFTPKKDNLYLDHSSIVYSVIFFICDFAITFLVYYILTYYHTSDIRLTKICIFINLLVLVISIIGILFIYRSQKHTILKNENEILHLQLESQIKLLETSEQKHRMIQSLRHDFKKYLINYRFLLEEGNVDDVLKSIGDLLDGPLENIDLIYTDNPMLNALIHSKMNICQTEKISFQTSIHINPLYRNIELMVLLSNLFDNAIEAELHEIVENRLILAEILENSQHLSIVIQNYIGFSVLEHNPELKSTKSPFAEHGIGLRNVKNLVNQLNGFIDIFEKEQMFNVHILIPYISMRP